MSAYYDEDDYESRHADELFRHMQEAEARASVNSGRSVLFAFWAVMLLLALLIAVSSPLNDTTDDEAYDRAKLECRLSGGTYEYFGTQGYHCIGAPSQAQGTDR